MISIKTNRLRDFDSFSACHPTAPRFSVPGGFSILESGFMSMKPILTNAAWLFAILLTPGTVRAAGLNDTGITFCGNASTNFTDYCGTHTSDSSSFPRQDVRYGRDAQAAAGQLTKVGGGSAGFDFSKIANNGNVFTGDPNAAPGSGPTDWACTRDNVTGLIWEVKTTSGLRSMSHTYTWYNSDTLTNGGAAGTASGGSCSMTGRCDTEKYVQDVNSGWLCGANDWRMPKAKELESIVDFGRTMPAIDPTYFANTASSFMWSGSLSAAGTTSQSWGMDLSVGTAYIYGRNNSMGVRLVRSGP